MRNVWTPVLTNRDLLEQFLTFAQNCKKIQESDKAKAHDIQHMLKTGNALTEREPALTIPVRAMENRVSRPIFESNFTEVIAQFETLVKSINNQCMPFSATETPPSPKAGSPRGSRVEGMRLEFKKSHSRIHLRRLDLTDEIAACKKLPKEMQALDLSLYEALDRFVNTCNSAFLTTLTVPSARGPRNKEKTPTRQTSITIETLPKTKKTAMDLLSTGPRELAYALSPIISKLSDYVSRCAAAPLAEKETVPVHERYSNIKSLLKQLNLPCPNEAQAVALLESNDFFPAFHSHLENALKLRNDYIEALNKQNSQEMARITPLINARIEHINTHCAQNQFVDQWTGVVKFATLVTMSLLPTNIQVLTDLFPVALYSRDFIMNHSSNKLDRAKRNFERSRGDQSTPVWIRALLNSEYGIRFQFSNEVYNCCRVESETPYNEEGKRHFIKGKFILGYAYPSRRKAAEVGIQLDLTKLEMTFEETEVFMTQLAAFIDLRTEDGQELIENGFQDHIYISAHPKKDLVIAIFTTFRQSAETALNKVFFDATNKKPQFADIVVDATPRFNQLGEEYAKCDSLIKQAELNRYLDDLIEIYGEDGVCDSLVKALDHSSPKPEDITSIAEMLAKKLFPADENKKSTFKTAFSEAAEKAHQVE